MRIHRIKLCNYRGVSQSEVTFSAQGVTIIEGDNEIGKTSLSEAIDLLLGERDDSSKQRVRAVKPVHLDVGAEAEMEMSTGPYRFVYRKRWHRQRETVLDILEPTRSQFTGRDAHDKVRAMLDETLDETLWEAFRLKQGAKLEQAAFAGGSLGRALDKAAGGDTTGDREDDLWERITAERERYWTATGQVKTDRTVLANRVAEAAANVAALETTLRSLDDDAAAVDRLCDEAKVLVERQNAHKESEDELVARFETIQNRRSDVTRLEGLRDTALAQRDRMFGVGLARADLRLRVADTAAAVVEIESQVDGSLPARQEVLGRLTAVQQKFDAVKAEIVKAEVAERRAISDRDFLRQQIEVEQTSERLSRATAAVRRRNDAEAVLESSRVDDALVARIEAAGIEVAKAEAAAAAGAATITVEAIANVDLEIDGQMDALHAGTRRQVMVDGSTEVIVPGLLGMVVNAGAEAQAKADRLTEARAAFRATCDEGGVDDLAGARLAATQRNEATRALVETAKSIKDDLRDLTFDALAQKVANLTARIARYGEDRPADSPLPSDHDAAEMVALECDTELQLRREELDRLEKDLTRARDDGQALDLADASNGARLEQAQIAAAQELSSLADARGVLSDEAIDTQLADAEATLSARAAELSEVQDQLAAQDPETVEELLGNARAVRARLAAELHDNDVALHELRTKLSLLGEEGLATQLDSAKSELAHLTVTHQQIEARAAAAKLLFETFSRRRSEAHHRYVAPFREGIESLGRLVFGSSLGVELADDLSIARRTLDGVTLDFAELSTGAKEQLGMISRLACASIVATDGGAPVIFDDALGWSDPRKLERMGAAISKAGRSCQIIVLTCTPGRYASVGDAEVVQLAS
jgi:AAA ATPase domain